MSVIKRYTGSVWETLGGNGAMMDMFANLASAENSISGAATAVSNRMNVCSGTTYTVTLPTPAAGMIIGVRVTATGLVTVDAGSGNTVNGTDQSKIMWARESVILIGVNSTTWAALSYNARPMSASIELITTPNNSVMGIPGDGTPTKVLYNTVVTQCVAMARTANNDIQIARSGLYAVRVGFYTVTTTDGVVWGFYAKKNSGASYLAGQDMAGPSAGGIQAVANRVVTLSANDTVEGWTGQTTGTTKYLYGISTLNTIDVTEFPQW